MYAARFENSQTAYGEALKKHKPFYELVQHIEVSIIIYFFDVIVNPNWQYCCVCVVHH